MSRILSPLRIVGTFIYIIFPTEDGGSRSPILSILFPSVHFIVPNRRIEKNLVLRGIMFYHTGIPSR